MCNECCRRIRGWCRSFTLTEVFLSILEAVLLMVLTAFLIFLILHFLVCSEKDSFIITATSKADEATPNTISKFSFKTVPPHVKCTWNQSHKTAPVTNYYEQDLLQETKILIEHTLKPDATISSVYSELPVEGVSTSASSNSSDDGSDLSNGKEAVQEKQYILALVKIRSQYITFGCMLTIITEYWVLTAASCIEAIEEVDSLNSFVMMEGYGEVKQGRAHIVNDVRIHPWYQGANMSYDVAALKSEDRLINEGDTGLALSTLLDYYTITLGEKLVLLGYGKYRRSNESQQGRGLRRVEVAVLPSRRCSVRGGGREVCAGRPPCGRCAGAPLLRGARLLALLPAAPRCRAACPPARYVNLPLLGDWLQAVVGPD
ncbi:trypsin, alkaline C-like [Achroia grisella]|uniref:trypsin, alkaline C-like n=1 Tax=Achroia grisella TaxID=688607 RepID=UPI0027D23FD9|nr:trypsin, alkaline C-like [Achroia grisella]